MHPRFERPRAERDQPEEPRAHHPVPHGGDARTGLLRDQEQRPRKATERGYRAHRRRCTAEALAPAHRVHHRHERAHRLPQRAPRQEQRGCRDQSALRDRRWPGDERLRFCYAVNVFILYILSM